MNELRVLLVESEPGDASFIREALIEVEEMTHGGAWIHCRVDHVERADEAVMVLEAGPPDVVLFNPMLPDSRGLATFTTLHDAAAEIALIALLDAGDEGLGRRMLRQGAQDYLIKNEIDCRPLARMLLNAIERQRYGRTLARSTLTDEETGFYNAEGFRTAAARDIALARQCGHPLALLLAEIDSLVEMDAAYGREAVHQLVAEAANVVRAAAGATALLARHGTGRFAVLAWADDPGSVIGAIQNQVQAGFHTFAFLFGQAFADPAESHSVESLLKTAEAALYENRQAYPSFP
ncbi:MAG: diguanylate cyclase [Acidobacteria bacterium]|nr:diguanylate cyclase [Acidobacteriota bacterium]